MAKDRQAPERAWPRSICQGTTLKRVFRAATTWLETHSEEINALNVFPVPDGDTGTNMLLTCLAARQDMDKDGDSIPSVMHAISHGSLMGARGNSGVILSQILRGMARSFDNKTRISAADIAAALQEGSVTAYKGVLKPVEGTILTVIRETAEAAAQCVLQTEDISILLETIVAAAHDSVERTPSLLPALRLAGVVDAGGQGFYIMLEGVQRFARGQSMFVSRSKRANLEQTREPDQGFGYDIQYIIHGANLNVEDVRAHVAAMGDSTLVVGDEQTIKVHVHAPNPGPVLLYGASVGPLSHVVVENMEEQFQQFKSGQKPGSAPAPTQNLVTVQSSNAAQLTGISTVVVASGDGFDKLLRSLDVGAVVHGGQTMNPSTQEILQAIESVATAQVIVLPNNKNIILTAQQAQKLSNKSVVVVPTTTVPQGIAALLALNYDADLAANKKAMEEAAKRVTTAEITTAVRDTQLDGMAVRKGDFIGLIDDHLVATGANIDEVITETVAKMEPDHYELLTFYYGNGVHGGEARKVVARAQKAHSAMEMELVEGGQPHYMYIISAE